MPFATKFARVAADIKGEAKTDALIDAEQAVREANLNVMNVRGMKPATAQVFFGSLPAWRDALTRLYTEEERCIAAHAALAYPGASVTIDMEQIARPVAVGSGVRSTGC